MGDPPAEEQGPDIADEGVTHQRTTAKRFEATAHRRDETADERDVLARRRDESSTLRDDAADSRDQEATDLDAQDDLADRHTQGLDEIRGRGRASRRRAADDRAHASRDRAEATGDRRHAGTDRRQAADDREDAGFDELTGARRRGVGLEELDSEMKRARREGKGLTAAYVDVDDLKSVNDERGHAAGDEVLRAVADGLRRHMRAYDLLVRLGGDEFLCVLPNVTAVEACERLGPLLAELKSSGNGSVSIGYSELRDGESADEFVGRADSALIAHRRE
jgi:diguanylate cyclase (GGDEF)-like protein